MIVVFKNPIILYYFYEYLLLARKKSQPAFEDLEVLLRSPNKCPTTHELRGTSALFELHSFPSYLRFHTCIPFIN
ncbi:unnamed protein product [Hymenolepis diminuta]|uniref:Uncharacterized protein n=1 Tax=Hymenolepis diminuta TaxID=6216 RepID=A0A564YLP4_HYMDI|nr:unnamed protein product [Hymenolepis diminuta]